MKGQSQGAGAKVGKVYPHEMTLDRPLEQVRSKSESVD